MRLKYLLIAILLMPSVVFSQDIPVDTLPSPAVPDSADADSLISAPADTISSAAGPDSTAVPDSLARPDSLQPARRDTLIPLKPWAFHRTVGTKLAVTDSLLRWEIWPSIADRMHRQPGIISYRLGTVGQPSALQIGTAGPNEQELQWEQMSVSDPVSGTVNWNFMPLNKIKQMEQQDGIRRQFRFRMNPYYILKPLSRLNYTESKYNYRHLEFMVTRNFTRHTNVELSYWYRKDGGGYPRTNLSGNQIYGSVWHQFDDQNAIRASLLYNGYDLNESFGYVVQSVPNFSFNRFDIVPQQASAQSENTLSSLQLNYYRRAPDDSTDKLQAWGWMQNYGRTLYYSEDTTDVSLRTLGAGLRRRWLPGGKLRVETELNTEYATNKQDSSSLNRSSWLRLEGSANIVYEPLKLLTLTGRAEAARRTTGHDEFGAAGTIKLNITPSWSISGEAAAGQEMPTVQELYWQSNGFAADRYLDPEQFVRWGGGTSWRPDPALEIGLDVAQEQTADFIYLARQPDDLTHFMQDGRTLGESSARFFADWNSSRWEFSGSATVHMYNERLSTNTVPVVRSDPRIWLKGSAHWKDYVIGRAAYVKAGFYGMFTPGGYSTMQYRPELNRWAYPGDSRELPSFYRVDAEISARIRWMIITVRWENLFDNVGQLGYFETLPYAMPNRRFIFGIRAVFRN